MHEEMMVGFRRRRTQSRSGWGTPRPSLVASDVVSSRLVVGPVAAIIGGALGLTADANAANPDQLNLNPRPCRRHTSSSPPSCSKGVAKARWPTPENRP